jgi:hypothetical protein
MKTSANSHSVFPLLSLMINGKDRMRFLAYLAAVVIGSVGNLSIVPSATGQVYSSNAVAYINVTFVDAHLISNPLNHMRGNNVSNLFRNPPNGLMIYKYNQGSLPFKANIYYTDAGWMDPTMTLSPGEGAYVIVPHGVVYTATFVGTVPQGSLSVELPRGLSLISSPVPQAGKLVADLKFPVADGDGIFRWDSASQEFKAPNYLSFGEWDYGEPLMAVAEGFFLKAASQVTWSRTWSRNFSVSGGGTPNCWFTDIKFVNNNLNLEWTGGGTLESASVVTGPWTSVTGSASPFTTSLIAAQQYYRIRQ